MVFIGNPRSETNREEGDLIVLRSKHSNLDLRHTCSILSIKIEIVEMGVVRVVIPSSSHSEVSIHPSFVHAARSRNKKAWQWAMEATALAVHG